MNIYVGNFSFEVTEEDIRQEFMAFGEVVSVTMMDRRFVGNGQSRGYGFVEMPSPVDGQAAISALHGTTIRDCIIDVIQALPLSDSGGNGSHGHKKGARYGLNSARRR
jgi:RNA recognition motif-containing protein